MPVWMGSSWAARGDNGWWSTLPPHLVIGHVVTLNYNSIFKDYIWKALQHWNWEAEEVGPVQICFPQQSCLSCRAI